MSSRLRLTGRNSLVIPIPGEAVSSTAEGTGKQGHLSASSRKNFGASHSAYWKAESVLMNLESMSVETFTLANYERLLVRGINSGYRTQTLIRRFRQATSALEGRTLLLRHDVDLSLSDARQMARLEANLGVKSTYFVRVRAAGYNPFAHENHAVLDEIRRLGHEIGLHSEANLESTKTAAHQLLVREKCILESILNYPVAGVALHLPKRGIPLFADVPASSFGFDYEAYGDEIMGGFRFISDSNRKWGKGSPVELLGTEQRIYLLVHPFWWVQSHLSDEEVETMRLRLLRESGILESPRC